jgi:hypothetical protein
MQVTLRTGVTPHSFDHSTWQIRRPRLPSQRLAHFTIKGDLSRCGLVPLKSWRTPEAKAQLSYGVRLSTEQVDYADSPIQLLQSARIAEICLQDIRSRLNQQVLAPITRSLFRSRGIELMPLTLRGLAEIVFDRLPAARPAAVLAHLGKRDRRTGLTVRGLGAALFRQCVRALS